jgi:hypothetical protein
VTETKKRSYAFGCVQVRKGITCSNVSRFFKGGGVKAREGHIGTRATSVVLSDIGKGHKLDLKLSPSHVIKTRQSI